MENKTKGIIAILTGILLFGAGIYMYTHTETQEKAQETAINNLYATEGNISFDKFFDFTGNREVLNYELDAGRYEIRFKADKPVQFIMYDETHYNQMLGGYYGINKITTKSGSKCCEEEGRYIVDINQGESGNYYFVFDDKDNKKPTQGMLSLVMLIRF